MEKVTGSRSAVTVIRVCSPGPVFPTVKELTKEAGGSSPPAVMSELLLSVDGERPDRLVGGASVRGRQIPSDHSRGDSSGEKVLATT